MTQPIITYNLTWGTGNVYQKLSGKTYTAPNGQTVDCSTLTVTFSSSKHFKKFYATAVKDGNDYGFIEDVLVDIREINPTGILLYELTSRNANVDFTFTINSSSLTAGDGLYRIGLYIQDDDDIWNYEYFLVDSSGNQLVDSQGNNLQVPVQNNFRPEGLWNMAERIWYSPETDYLISSSKPFPAMTENVYIALAYGNGNAIYHSGNTSRVSNITSSGFTLNNGGASTGVGVPYKIVSGETITITLTKTANCQIIIHYYDNDGLYVSSTSLGNVGTTLTLSDTSSINGWANICFCPYNANSTVEFSNIHLTIQ